ncbi:phage holin, lambda family [Acinetobacter rathckeae]|uniref:phage holin, lambda family n=1 Tax=Acinetobacter rathckeae TaxID=2605272 RepID=UPI0018A31CE8|nr:phage holin, lambda family [Acinetobacter rathckeae]MBF7687859.1 phage holin, lambda family [Acinetobacter rathckeae]MBF7687918.1 phage holin, lambda family [Acinetobacter rathckeae]MBF7696029.1 phage holin, lambda family [Acinetobacter rathckeae]
MLLHELSIVEIIKTWWQGDMTFYGVLMSIVMAILRMIYTGASWTITICEGLLCGALTLTAVSTMNYFNVPSDLTVAIGGFIGFIGVKKLTVYIHRFLDKKL